MRRVTQRQNKDCAVACLATVTGESWHKIRGMKVGLCYRLYKRQIRGTPDTVAMLILRTLGVSYRRLLVPIGRTIDDFSRTHLAGTYLAVWENPIGTTHMVVVHKGEVFDPGAPYNEGKSRRRLVFAWEIQNPRLYPTEGR